MSSRLPACASAVLALLLVAAIVADATLVACGDFRTPTKYIAAWNGTAWGPVADGLHSGVDACVSYRGELIASGGPRFVDTETGEIAHGIANWNGSVWRPLGGGLRASTEYEAFGFALAVDDSGDNLYVGGQFTHAGGVAASNVARWDGTQWAALGEGMSNMVYDLLASTDRATGAQRVVAGGRFERSGSTVVNYIAQWDGQQWLPMATGMNSDVFALASDGGRIFAGGWFTEPALAVAQWDGATWSAVGSGIVSPGGLVNTLALVDGTLLAGGYVYLSGQTEAYVARWDGAVWSALAAYATTFTFPTFVETITSYKDSVFVGGQFMSADETQQGNVVQWTGDLNTWTFMGTGSTPDTYEMVSQFTDYSGPPMKPAQD